jgi:transcriptional regulator with XRE-family HTH domain
VANPNNRRKTPARIAFGKIARQKRQDLGLTQEELAERAELHPTYIGSVERGERNIALENILLIAKSLNCSSKDLMPN